MSAVTTVCERIWNRAIFACALAIGCAISAGLHHDVTLALMASMVAAASAGVCVGVALVQRVLA